MAFKPDPASFADALNFIGAVALGDVLVDAPVDSNELLGSRQAFREAVDLCEVLTGGRATLQPGDIDLVRARLVDLKQAISSDGWEKIPELCRGFLTAVGIDLSKVDRE